MKKLFEFIPKFVQKSTFCAKKRLTRQHTYLTGTAYLPDGNFQIFPNAQFPKNDCLPNSPWSQLMPLDPFLPKTFKKSKGFPNHTPWNSANRRLFRFFLPNYDFFVKFKTFTLRADTVPTFLWKKFLNSAPNSPRDQIFVPFFGLLPSASLTDVL